VPKYHLDRETIDNADIGIFVGGNVINTIRYANNKAVVANSQDTTATTHKKLECSYIKTLNSDQCEKRLMAKLKISQFCTLKSLQSMNDLDVHP